MIGSNIMSKANTLTSVYYHFYQNELLLERLFHSFEVTLTKLSARQEKKERTRIVVSYYSKPKT